LLADLHNFSSDSGAKTTQIYEFMSVQINNGSVIPCRERNEERKKDTSTETEQRLCLW